MTWFRLYNDFIDDPKIGTMPDLDQLLWAKLLCLASADKQRGSVTLAQDEICFKLRVDANTWQRAKAKFEAKGMIQVEDDRSISIIGWHESQPAQTTLRPSAADWKALREIVFERDDYTCQYCKVRGVQLQCDHVIPVSRGGSNDLSNLVTACAKCNRSKHARTPEEWLGGRA